jgi:ABC-type phosphate transport system substrate-binding protein
MGERHVGVLVIGLRQTVEDSLTISGSGSSTVLPTTSYMKQLMEQYLIRNPQDTA